MRSSRLLSFLRWVLFVAPMIILLAHACIPLAGGHVDMLDLAMGEHHTSNDPHHEKHLVSCDQVPLASRGLLQAPIVSQVGDIMATSIDSASIVDADLPISTAAVDLSHLPIFLLHTSFLI
jgi:hypothetical protein